VLIDVLRTPDWLVAANLAEGMKHACSSAKDQRAIWWACWSAILLAGLLLRFLDSTAYLFHAIYDDQLMVVMARGFLQGQWSSTWASTGPATLSKPVGYPLFLAGAHFFPWSPVWSAYLLYVIGSALIAWSWFRMRGSRPQATVVLAMLVFNPIAFTAESNRLYRDLYIMALATLALGVIFVLATLLHHGAGSTEQRGDRADGGRWLDASTMRRWGTVYALVVLSGLILGLAAITKPTWLWLLPAAVAPVAYPLLQRLWPPRLRLRRMLCAAMAGVVALGCFWGVIHVTKQLDYRHYHVALLDDMSSGAFERAWKLWASVEAGPPRRYVPITREMRLAVYRVSPTAAEMEPYLEYPKDQWKLLDCSTGLRICNESGPWFEWDLLLAAYRTGKVNSVRQIQTYFNKVADDIARACTRGQLHCSSSPVLETGLPTLNQIPLLTVASDTMDGLGQMVWDQQPMVRATTSWVTPAAYHLWASVVPGMPPLGRITRTTGGAGVYPILRVMDVLYRIVDLAVLAAITLGLATWLGAFIRRPLLRRRPHPDAGTISILLFVSTLIGMATLAVCAAAEDPVYIFDGYWTDFASIAQLCLVFGLFSLAPLRHQRFRRIRLEFLTATPKAGAKVPAGARREDELDEQTVATG
jgi:hypothetical protein